ncbi:MAG: insulinase family protein [Spirochaetales bacterium]|nr:insulinase family protein [Spirochaetales bacterium]
MAGRERTPAEGVRIVRDLPGGALALLDVEPRARGAAVGFWYPSGSRDEADDQKGYTHFVEHMVFKGTATRGPEDIAREADRVGGWLNAFTEREATCFHCSLPGSALPLAIDLLSDMAHRSVFDPEEFEREREVVANEAWAALDDPEESGQDAFLARLWPGQAMGRKIQGEPEDVAAIERERLVGYWREHFGPSRLVVSIAGGFDPDEALRALERSLPRDAAARAPRPSPRPVAAAPFRAAEAGKARQTHFYAGIPLEPPFDREDYWALSIASAAWGEAMGSRLFLALRERAGLCYSVWSGAGISRDAGLWSVFASTRAASFPKLAELYDEELERFATGGLEAAEFADAVSHLAGSTEVGADDMEFRMRRLARQWFFDGNPESVEASVCALRRSGLERVNESVRRRIDPSLERRLAWGRVGSRVETAISGRAGR